MLYYLTTFPRPDSQAVQQEELAKLVKNTGHFTLHALNVNGRYGLYIEVANTISTMVEMRLLPTLTGIEGSLERRQTWVHRPEWALHALLTPTKEAQDLDVSVLQGASSACLTLRWTRSGVIGDLYASADDVPLLDAITNRGWEARIPPKGFAGKIALLAHRPVKTHLKPLIALFDPNQAAEKAAPAAQTGIVPQTNEASPSVPPAAPAVPTTSIADELLTHDGSGLLIGMGENGKPIGLHFRPQRLALIAGPQHEAALALLIARAFGLGAGVVAIVPSTVAALLRQSGFRERLRFLDANDPYQSASIPWRSLDPLTLDAALASTGLPTSNGQGHQAASFVDLLPDYLANDETRLLTAPPGDDLRGVVTAGGGVILVEDMNNPHLAALLLHLMIGELGRPLVVIRPDYLPLPEALEGSAFDIVLGEAPSHTILRELPDAWTISDADARWSERLQRDLQAVSLSTDEGIQSALMAGLEGQEERQAAPALPSNKPEAPLWEVPAFELEPAATAHAEEVEASNTTLTSSELTSPIEEEREVDETADDDLTGQIDQAPAWLKQAIEEADTREEPSILGVVEADMEFLDPPTLGVAIAEEPKAQGDDLEEEPSEIEPLFAEEIEATHELVGADAERAPELLPFEADQWSIDLSDDEEEPEETEEIIQPRRAVSRVRVIGRRRIGLKPRFTSQQSAPVVEATSEVAYPTTNGIAETSVDPDTETEMLLAEQGTELELPLVVSLAEQISLVIEQADLEPEQPLVVPSKPHIAEQSSPTTNGTANGFVVGSTAYFNGQTFRSIASVTTSSEIDLAPVAELIQIAREQDQSLPSLIAQIAPHYPQVAPAALRRAVRAMLDQPSSGTAVTFVTGTPATLHSRIKKHAPTPKSIVEPEIVPVAEFEEAVSNDDDPPALLITEPYVGATEEEEESACEKGEEQPEQPEEPSYSTTEAARFLKVAPRTIQRWADDGKLVSFRDEENNRRFVESELKRVKDEREAGR